MTPRDRSLVGLAAVLAIAGGGGAAEAQDPPRGQTVQERRQPDFFDARGVRAGSVIFYPEVTLQSAFNDNVFAEEDDEESDFVTVLTPEISFETLWSRHEVGGRVWGRASRYLDNTSENAEEYGASAYGRLDLGNQIQVDARARAAREALGRADPDDTGRDEPTEVNELNADLEIEKQFNRLILGAGQQFFRQDYVDSIDDDRDQSTTRWNVLAGYELSPSLEVFAEPFYSIRRYDETAADSRDADIYGALVGTRFDISGLWIGQIDIGVYQEDFDSDQFDDYTGIITRTRFDWLPTDKTTVSFGLARSDEATTEAGASSRVETEAFVGVAHELTRAIIIDGEISYTRNDWRGVERTDDTYRAGAGVEWLLNRNLSVFSAYEFTTRGSDVDTAEFDRSIITFGLKAKL